MPRCVLTLLTALAMAATAAAQAATWKIDPMHSAAQFSVRHLGVSTVRGAFTKVSGSATFDPADPSKTALDATIDAASVDTRVEMRDNDLRSPNFLDASEISHDHFPRQANQSRWRRQTADHWRSDHSRRHQRSGARCRRPLRRDQRSMGQPAHRRIGEHQNEPRGLRCERPSRSCGRRNHHHD